jgi:hypothetical protein
MSSNPVSSPALPPITSKYINFTKLITYEVDYNLSYTQFKKYYNPIKKGETDEEHEVRSRSVWNELIKDADGVDIKLDDEDDADDIPQSVINQVELEMEGLIEEAQHRAEYEPPTIDEIVAYYIKTNKPSADEWVLDPDDYDEFADCLKEHYNKLDFSKIFADYDAQCKAEEKHWVAEVIRNAMNGCGEAIENYYKKA